MATTQLSKNPTPALLDSVTAFLGQTHQLLINNEWVPAANGQTFEVFNPANGEVIARVADGGKEDIDRAVSAARAAFETGPWRRTKPADRTKLIWKLADLLETHVDEFAQLESLDNGKPIRQARYGDIPGAIGLFRYMAGWATKIQGHAIPFAEAEVDAYHAYTRREPIGVVGQIIPWNFPLMMASWKLGPALAAGCTIVLKPAEQTPLTALRLGELIQEAGFPAGVVNIVTGDGPNAGAPLAAHHDVDKIAFTGSTEVGKLIVNAATDNLKKVSLELGGKSLNIVFADADIEAAIPAAANAIFFNQGQCCTAGSRLFVHKSVYDRVLAGVSDHAGRLVVGPGLAPDTDIGPLVSDEQLQRVTGYIGAGTAAGARAVTGGERVGDHGYFVAPTVFTDVRDDMSIYQEEIFGPVVTAVPFADPEEIVARANNTAYGLMAGIWTRDISVAHKLAARIKSGKVTINCYDAGDPALPFGGFKQSGWGREMGQEVLELYTETKSVVVQL